MRLFEITKLLITARLIGDGNVAFHGMDNDSRTIAAGMLYVCVRGYAADGHQFAGEAVDKGAVAIVTERQLDCPVPQIIVKDSKHAMAIIASALHGRPSEKMKVIGVTGTNGKTTTTYLIEQLLTAHNKKTGVIGTIESRYNNRSYPMQRTTPLSLELQRCLGAMRDAGTEFCAMEVSSHALEQGRVIGCHFRTAIFTNLTQDHLDFHGTMERYQDAKGLFFSRLGNGISRFPRQRSYAVLNADDEASHKFAKLTSAEVVTYGIKNKSDVSASLISMNNSGSVFRLSSFKGDVIIHMPLAGKFNVYNALAAIAAALIEGVELAVIKQALEQIEGVPGRVERIDEGQPFAVLVDYAHTPDGLKNVLEAVHEFAKGKVITVFGCGGDRDRRKRPLMGKIAASYSDAVLITSDNPRSENAMDIMKDIEIGCKEAGFTNQQYKLVEDRREAIKIAVEMASPSDVVLIAGKGHETYQLIDGISYPFDDRLVAKEAIRGL